MDVSFEVLAEYLYNWADLNCGKPYLTTFQLLHASDDLDKLLSVEI